MSRDVRKTRSYARGVVTLIFFVLAVQVAIFTIKSYEITKQANSESEVIPDTLSYEVGKTAKPAVSETSVSAKKVNGYRPKYKKAPYVSTRQEAVTENPGQEERPQKEAYIPVDIKSISSKVKRTSFLSMEFFAADLVSVVALSETMSQILFAFERSTYASFTFRYCS